MAPSQGVPARKPSGGRPTPRRLFSFDSAKSSSSSSRVRLEAPPVIETRAHARNQSKTSAQSTLRLVDQEKGDEDVFNDNSGGRQWTEKDISESPRSSPCELDTVSVRSDEPSSVPENRATSTKPYVPRPTPLSTNLEPTVNPADLVPPTSPSKARWEHLRQHVLPRSTTTIPTPSSSRSAQTTFSQTPPRSQTPKPSRFQRLGLFGVVEQAREVAADESRKFADDIQRACWSARFVEPFLKGAKSDREPAAGTVGSNFHLPASLTSTANSSTTTLVTLTQQVQKKHDLRRPQSQASLSLTSRSLPSLKNLRQILLYHASPSDDHSRPLSSLPHESLVLSTLLRPFLMRESNPNNSTTSMDEERCYAIESFEAVVQAWIPSSHEMATERCLWCCKAASISHSPLRVRILRVLSQLLLSPDRSPQESTSSDYQTLLQALFTLIPTLSSNREAIPELQLLKGLILKVQTGAYLELDQDSVEKDFNSEISKVENESNVMQVLLVHALVSCLENGTDSSRRWMLSNMLEEYWPLPEAMSTDSALLSTIHSQTLRTFCRAALTFVSTKSVDATAKFDVEAIIHILLTRVIPGSQALREQDAIKPRDDIIRVLLELFCLGNAEEIAGWASDLLCRWYHDVAEWKASLENALTSIIGTGTWPIILRTLSTLVRLASDEVRKPIFAFTLPVLHERLVIGPPQFPCLPLTALLNTISHLYPQIFYKPLFACAASSTDTIVVNHIWTLTVISKFLPDFWIRDAEMMSIALMGNGRPKAADGEPVRGKARLGQSVLLLELIAQIQTARKATDLPTDQSHSDMVRFYNQLESRLSIFIEAKEQTTLVPFSQRLLFCTLFLEIRLLTRSLKTSALLSRVVSWLLQSSAELGDGNVTVHDEDTTEEMAQSIDKLHVVYISAREGPRATQKNRSTMVLLSNVDNALPSNPSRQGPIDHFTMFGKRARFIATLTQLVTPKALELLVALSGLMSLEDFRRIGPFIWDHCLDSKDVCLLPPACFMTMQCAEKTPDEFVAHVQGALQSLDSDVRYRAIQRIGTLSNWRFQILSQQVILDRSHRRPFKLARGPLPFIATDIGSSQFILEDDPTDLKDNLPLELRKRLSEIGWAQDETPSDQRREWTRTPISLLPSYQLDRLESGTDQPLVSPSSPSISPSPSPQKSSSADNQGGLRRKTSTVGAGHGMRRRAIFVPALATVFPRLSSLVVDPNFAVSSLARNVIVDLMRNDPSLLSRPLFDLFAEDEKNIDFAVSSLRELLHVRRLLPPAMAHHIFNHLAGFLKSVSRQDEPSSEPLRSFAHSIPILARLVTQVSDMSMREIRRAKVEMFLIPSGSLWFSSAAPVGPMFPRALGVVANPFDPVPPRLVWITMIRLSQITLFLSMLKRNPQDVQVIRKNIPRLVLPSMQNVGDLPPLDLPDYVPHKAEPFRYAPFSLDSGVKGFSLMISRSYLLLIAQVFRSMSRHVNDRSELAVLIDGLNRILLAHGDDIGIVSQALIALMVASTRFRRLFTSGGGYTLFMPALMKVYTESEAHVGIRLAIEYAVNRFYALHQESFIFQSLDIISHVVMVPNIDGDWVAKSVYTLFSALRRGISPTTSDAAGIHNANKGQEREALLVSTAEEKPQTFLASLRRGGQGNGHVLVDLPEEYESNRLHIDDFVRLFLTVIAHDPTIVRAEQFLRLLRYLAPYLYNALSSARIVLRDGIDALGIVLTRAIMKPKVHDGTATQPASDYASNSGAGLEDKLLNRSKSPSDILAMRQDYLSLVVGFTAVGGRLGGTAHQRTIDLTKTMLRDTTRDNSIPVASFFTDYAKASLLRDEPPSLKDVTMFLRDLAPVVSAYSMSVDFTGIFETVSQLAANPVYANDPQFSRLVKQFCAAGLEACEVAASERLLLSLSSRPSLVSLIAQAIGLRAVDVVAEVERRTPSYEFLCGVVLPLVIALKTTAEVVADGQWADAWRRDAHARTWIRLLSYVMSVCNKKDAGTLDPPERSRSRDRRDSTSSGKSHMKRLVAAIQILKVIIIRAEDDLSACLPGIWSRVASFLKELLADGNTTFAFSCHDSSLPPSPAQSPRASLSSYNITDQSLLPSTSADLRSSLPSTHQFSNPRIVDYSLWSLLELLCLCRSPLMVQMRLFIQEKVVVLDQELRAQQSNIRPTGSRGRRASSSSMFSKPRRRISGYQSGVSSADSSPVASTSQSFPNDLSLFVPDVNIRQPGYSRSPSSPGKQEPSGPRIVHLGPISRTGLNFRRSVSPGVGFSSVHSMAKSAVVKSLKLVLGTYRRIRLVQTCMGYDVLLPFPKKDIDGRAESIDDDDESAGTRTWTRKQALQAVVEEARELMEEFDEGFREVEDDMVVVDADESVTF